LRVGLERNLAEIRIHPAVGTEFDLLLSEPDLSVPLGREGLRSGAVNAVRAAIASLESALGITASDRPGWTPHVTLCYSTANQPAEPIIEALGKSFPGRGISVSGLSLVIQDGPERDWTWTTVGTVHLQAPALA
jgi:hypothetical protein